MRRVIRVAGVLLAAASSAFAQGDELLPPVKLEAAGEPIDTGSDIGHSAPGVCDWDGDGKRDLLVGQFRGGKLRIYRNVGSDAQPKFSGYEFFKVGTSDAVVPTG